MRARRSACRTTSRACSGAWTASGSPIRTRPAQWERLIAELVALQPFADQVGLPPGDARRRAGATTPSRRTSTPTVFMMANPLPVPSREQVERGVAVVTAEDNRWQRCDLKTISLLGNVLMRQLAAEAGAVETVMFRDGWLTEASASNVLVVLGGTIVAPPKDNLILPGITYDATFEFAREAGLPVAMRPVREGRGARRGRDVAVVVDQGGARGHERRRQAVRGRRARPRVPQALAGLPGAQAARLTRCGRAAIPAAASSARKRPWWKTSPGPWRRPQRTTSPMKSTWSPARAARGGGTRTTRRPPRSAAPAPSPA